MPQIGDVLADKYRLIRKLGTGGMGTVYEAVHEQIGKHLAVKVLHQDMTMKPDLVARFTREAQAAGAIGHRAIIDVHDIGTAADGSLFLVMEYLQGQNLAQLLKQVGFLDINAALYVVCQVLSALSSAHQKGIVHRDLKPDNIFLVQTGQVLPEIKLLDFGISKMQVSGTPDDHLTRTGTIMGTPFYMAPEQARGRKELDHRVDVYAMGVILYESLVGRVPFWAENTFALVYEIINSPLTPPRAYRPEIPEVVEQVITKAMARDPAARYGSALEMLTALLPSLDLYARGQIILPQEVMAQGGGVAAGIDSIPGMARGPSGAMALTPSPGAVAVPSTPGTPMSWTGSTSGAVSPAPAKSRVGLFVGVGAAAVLLLGVGAVVLALVFRGGAGVDEPTPQPPPLRVTAPGGTTAQPTPGPTAPGPTTPTADAAPPAAPPTVAITLQGLPEGARVLLDDAAVEGTVLRGQRSAEAHRLRVEAPNHQPYDASVTFDQDRELAVAMVATSTEPETPPVASVGAESPRGETGAPPARTDHQTTRTDRAGGGRDPGPRTKTQGGGGRVRFDTSFE